MKQYVIEYFFPDEVFPNNGLREIKINAITKEDAVKSFLEAQSDRPVIVTFFGEI